MGWVLSTHEYMRSTYKQLVKMPERKRPIGRSGSRSKDNIKINLREIEFGRMD
jgi:hypothetical protein